MQNVAAIASSHAYVRVLKRWWWLPVTLALVSGVITYIGTQVFIPPVYGSSLTVQLLNTQPGTSGNAQVLTGPEIANDMMSTSVIQLAWHLMHYCQPHRQCQYPPGVLDPKSLTQRISCIPDSTGSFVTCTTTSRNPAVPPSTLHYDAVAYLKWESTIFNSKYHSEEKNWLNAIHSDTKAIGKVLKQLSQNADSPSLLNSLTQLRADRSSANTQLINLETTITSERGIITIPNGAKEQTAPVSPHPLRNALLGGIVGIGLAAGLIVLLEYLDDTFRSADEIVEATNLPLLGAVRRYDGTANEMATVAARMPRTAIAEAYRVARANIQFTEIGGNLKILVVTSARDGEGKTTTANNLATTFALAGQRVLLVDADLRRPGLTKIMGMRENQGLSSALLDPEADVVSPTEVVGLSVVPSGAIPPNPSELLGSQRMRSFVENAARNYDLVILDTPPVLSVADTRILATVADGVILVLDPAITTRRMVRQARIAVENVGGRLLGVMLNRDVMRGEGYYYNYYYYERRVERDKGATRRSG